MPYLAPNPLFMGFTSFGTSFPRDGFIHPLTNAWIRIMLVSHSCFRFCLLQDPRTCINGEQSKYFASDELYKTFTSSTHELAVAQSPTFGQPQSTTLGQPARVTTNIINSRDL